MTNARILIVDDDRASRETLADLLAVDNYQIDMAPESSYMFELLEQAQPDVILLDVMMPRMDGFEVCEILKNRPKWSHIPVVLITALNDHRSLLKGLQSGADEFLSKPVGGPELRARVRNMVRLSQQHDALEKTIAMQDDLVRIVVHDMRSPLSTILLYAGSLLVRSSDDAEKQRLSMIDAEAQRLDRFFDELLILIRQDKDQIRLNLLPLNIGELVRKAIKESLLMVELAGLKVDFQNKAENQIIPLDPNLFRRVVDNLLSNAIKRSPAGGTINICLNPRETADSGSNGLCLSIADQGEAISAENRQKIFDVSEIIYLKRKKDLKPEIGLAFCKKVVEQHEGTIFVQDHKPAGSVFVVEL